MLYRTGYVVLMLLVFLCGCRLNKIQTSCLIGKNKNSESLKKEILDQIDSVYYSNPRSKIKKIVGSSCVNDSIIEVKTLNSLFIYDLFYFDNHGKLIEIKHQLKDLY